MTGVQTCALPIFQTISLACFLVCSISTIGIDYPFPIVDIEQTRKHASDIVWNLRKNSKVKQEGNRILKKHVNADDGSSGIFRGKDLRI